MNKVEINIEAAKVLSRITHFVQRHHRLITHFFFFDTATEVITCYYLFEDVDLIFVLNSNKNWGRVEFCRQARYEYQIGMPTIIFNSESVNRKFFSIEKSNNNTTKIQKS